MPRECFIPVVRDGDFKPGPNCSIPPHFLGVYAIDMRNTDEFDARLEDLLRAIFKQPAIVRPKIGSRPSFEESSQPHAEELENTRLAAFDIDGWHLCSGVAQHHRSPETFEIPPEQERRNLADGDIVKLIFEIAVPSDEEPRDVICERMWVIVRGRSGPYYIGELNNVPACSDEQENLQTGDRVIFLPEHVISIIDKEGHEIELPDHV